jgi:glycosyltransferase involved in cell wall biosynthesis
MDYAPLLPRLLANVQALADEIVLVDGGSEDRTVEVAERHPKVQLHRRPFDDAARQKNHAIGKARGDWVLIVDTDELLGDRLRRRIPGLLRHRRRRWFKFPRYWLAATDPLRYVAAPLLYPDWQLRLFRNLPFFRYEEGRPVHHRFPRRGRGPGARVRRSHIFHLDFLLRDRPSREEKVARYGRKSPGSAETNRMYLYEDLPHRLRRCRETVAELRGTGSRPLSS